MVVASVTFGVLMSLRPGLGGMPDDRPSGIEFGLPRPRQMHPRPAFASTDEYVVASVACRHDLGTYSRESVFEG